jgi:hypothetical protein
MKPRSHRELQLQAEGMLHYPNRVAQTLHDKDWELLKEFTKLLLSPPPKDLARTDPRRFRKWMQGVTECYILGWDNLNIKKLEELAREETKG